MEFICKRLARLLAVKSLVTLTLTIVFSLLAFRGTVDQYFMTIFSVIISFYFVTQSQESKSEGEEK